MQFYKKRFWSVMNLNGYDNDIWQVAYTVYVYDNVLYV